MESSICDPKDRGSKETETPVPKIPFDEKPIHPDKNRVIAEARFLRALVYFNLVRFYGDVPLVLDELLDLDNKEVTNQSRTSSNLVYDAIIDDLLATGGTVDCVASLIKKSGKEITRLVCF